MAFEIKQSLKLAQQLIMTPQLQQAIKLLQLSRLELAEVISQAVEANPLLEEVRQEEEWPQEEEWSREEPGEPCSLEGEDRKPRQRLEEITGQGDGREEYDWQSYFEDRITVSPRTETREGDPPNWDNLLSAKPSLTDHLMWQLKLSNFPGEEMKVGEYIIGNINGDGYLEETLESIGQAVNCEVALAQEVLKKIQNFDPPGIAARSLAECLLLQAEAVAIENPHVREIINHHLKHLENKNFRIIAKSLGISLEEVMEAVSLIRGMDPKPGEIYNEERIEAIIPDVYVLRVGDEYKIHLNEDNYPRLRISAYYRDLLSMKRPVRGADASKKYLRENLQSASWIIKSLQQRQKTIYRVAESILKFQRDFFDRGINHLRPLVLRDVAQDVEMHESTVSRVVTNKYMQSPRGLFELKYFFSSSLQRSNGDSIASKSVKEEIRKIISQENPAKPLRDQEIEKILKSQGISIARRTVAKYREMMGILPTPKRKNPIV